MTLIPFFLSFIGAILGCALIQWLQSRQHTKHLTPMQETLTTVQQQLHEKLLQWLCSQQQTQHEHHQKSQQALLQAMNMLQNNTHKQTQNLNEGMQQNSHKQTQTIQNQLNNMQQSMQHNLQNISGQVEKKLTAGFEKTNAIFANVMERLTIIDQAQKNIDSLSTQVLDLNSILKDKRSRGAFGEIQLATLVRNLMPESHISLQHTLSNGTRVDCLIQLPEPTGNLAIDAKFPLESFQTMQQKKHEPILYQKAKQQFRHDIKKHIDDIAKKYILPGETSDGALLFLPAEAIFADLHSYHPELIQYAYKKRVWLVSPTTMMAVLTTALAVLKDVQTREQVHVIQKHLGGLKQDFHRFQIRMNQLSKHISQAHKDVDEVHISATKISSRFTKIEQVELED
jgi:DNA recombination protein RmuC